MQVLTTGKKEVKPYVYQPYPKWVLPPGKTEKKDKVLVQNRDEHEALCGPLEEIEKAAAKITVGMKAPAVGETCALCGHVREEDVKKAKTEEKPKDPQSEASEEKEEASARKRRRRNRE